jgi:hypothetical protein
MAQIEASTQKLIHSQMHSIENLCSRTSLLIYNLSNRQQNFFICSVFIKLLFSQLLSSLFSARKKEAAGEAETKQIFRFNSIVVHESSGEHKKVQLATWEKSSR